MDNFAGDNIASDTVPGTQQPAPRHSGRAVKLALVGAGLAAGVIGATAFGASATTSGTGSTPSSAGSASTSSSSIAPAHQRPPGAPGHGHGAAPVRSDEKALSDADAATVKAAALKAVPGGTVYRVETDAGDGVYEAHMTKSDGSDVTVKLDKNFAVTKVETGMGQGDPHPAGAPGGPGGPGH